MLSACRSRALAVPLAIALALIGSGPAPATAAPVGKRIERQLEHVRVAAGLPAQRSSRSLRRSARAFAGHLLRSGRFAHASSIHMDRRFRFRGEALALCHGAVCSARRTVQAWLRSPPHRRLIFSRTFDRVGVGTAVGRFNGRRARIAVLHAGRR